MGCDKRNDPSLLSHDSSVHCPYCSNSYACFYKCKRNEGNVPTAWIYLQPYWRLSPSSCIYERVIFIFKFLSVCKLKTTHELHRGFFKKCHNDNLSFRKRKQSNN